MIDGRDAVPSGEWQPTHSCCEVKIRCNVAEETWQIKETFEIFPHSTDIVLSYERQRIPFRFYALNLWQWTREKPNAKSIVWFQIYFF